MTLVNPYYAYCGLDVGKKSYSVTILANDMRKSMKISADDQQFYSYMQKHYPDKNILYAYEAGCTGYHLYDYLKSQNCDCQVISPSSIPKPPDAKVKNNRIDSETIAIHLKGGTLKSIRVPLGPYRELRHLVKMREECANQQRKARQRIKALLLFENLYPLIKESDEKWSQRYIKSLKELKCSYVIRLRMDKSLSDLDYARKQLVDIYHKLKEFVKQNKEIENNVQYVQSIPGIGFITATAVIGKIGDPKELRDERELASFVGLTPREHSTGERERRGEITHLGDRYLRTLLIEAAWIAIRYDTQLNQFFYRIVNRNHPNGAALKAIVAVARKLTQRIYRVLKDQREYIIYKEGGK